MPPYSHICWKGELLRERQLNLPSTPEVSRARCARIPSSRLFFEATVKMSRVSIRKKSSLYRPSREPKTSEMPCPRRQTPPVDSGVHIWSARSEQAGVFFIVSRRHHVEAVHIRLRFVAPQFFVNHWTALPTIPTPVPQLEL